MSCEDRRVTGDEYRSQILRVSGALSARGIKEDDVVLLLMRNGIEFMVAAEAVARLGAYSVPLNWHGSPDEIAYIAQDSNAKAVIADTNLLHLVGQLDLPRFAVEPSAHAVAAYGGATARDLDVTATAWSDVLAGPAAPPPAARAAREPILYTSGTTGKPKGVRRQPPRDSGQAEAMRTHLVRALSLDGVKNVLAVAPLYHSGPLAYLRTAIAAIGDDGKAVIVPKFDAEQALMLIEQHRIDHVWMVPTLLLALLRLPLEVRGRYDLSSVRSILTTAAPCPPDLKKQLIDWLGPVIFEFYGSTEVGPVTLASPDDAARKPGTVGRIMPGATVAILSEGGEALPAGQIGEIACRHESFPEFTYWNREAERRALDRGDLVATGDVGYLDGDGYLFLCDRKSHMIISGGANIYPAEIESVVLEHPAVKDCAVFGIPDERFGEAVALAVEIMPGHELSARQVADFLRPRVASYKVPKLIEFHSALPRDDSGKIFKRILRAPFWQQLGRSI